MLLGEYAVLHGHHALVCAIDKRIHVTVTPRDDEQVILDSALGHYETTLSELQIASPFQFVLATLHSLKKQLHRGCHIEIASEFSATIGFASSAAVTVATLAALSAWLGLSFSSSQLIKRARKIVREVQGSGSGADVAACVLGGIVFYRMQPFMAEKLTHIYPITVIYSGYKTKTSVAIKQVQNNFFDFSEIFFKLMQTINKCTLQGVNALSRQDWEKLGKIMNIQQGLMEALGVSTTSINAIIDLLRQQTHILGAKISGSGLGDCVVGLGEYSLREPILPAADAKQIRVNMTKEGVRCEKI